MIKKAATDKFDICRDLQHAWKPVDAWREGKTFVETLRCERCNVRKDRVYDAKTGAILTTKHTRYPSGYLRPKGTGRMSAKERGAIRLSRLK